MPATRFVSFYRAANRNPSDPGAPGPAPAGAGYAGPVAPVGPQFYALAAGLAAVVLVAAVAWLVQLSEGLEATGLNANVTWGIYIVNFVFLIGLSAGGIIVAGLANVLGLERYRSVARLAELLAFFCLAFAGLSILMSLGRPDRVWELFVYGHWASPLLWDVFVVFSYMALTLGLLYFATRADLVRASADRPRLRRLYHLLVLGRTDLSPRALAWDRKALRALSLVAIPYAVVLHSVTAWILGLVKARPAWFSTLLAPLFVISALVSGLALVLLVAILAKRFLRARVSTAAITGLARLLFFCVPVLGYFLFAELLTVTFGGVPDEAVFFRDMMTGSYAWVFWFDLLGGLLLPLVLLAVPSWRAREPVVFAAALLVFLGVYAERFNLVVVPQFHKLLPHAAGGYAPTWVELAMTLGIGAATGLALMVLSRLVPLAEPEVVSSAGAS